MRHTRNHKHNILLCTLLAGILAFAMPASTYCTDFTEKTDTEEEIPEDNSEEPVSEEMLPENQAPVEEPTNRGERIEEYGEFDGYDDFVTRTSKSDVNNAQLNFKVNVPDGFNLGVYLQVTNLDNKKNYQLLATQENEFLSRLFVPDGRYEIMNCFVANDNTNKYPMEIPYDFDLAKNDVYTVTSTLLNYDEIDHEAKKRMGLLVEEESEEVVEEVEEAPKYDTRAIEPWRIVEHVGDSDAKISVSGLCTIPIDLIVKITTTGAEKEGEYVYSTDNGNTWSEVTVITGSEVPVVTTDTGEATGLKMRFENSRYLVNDEYRFSCIREYLIEADEVNGLGCVRLTSSDAIYNVGYDIGVKIASSGDVGEATFKLSMNGGTSWSDPITIPEDGVYNIPNTLLSISFWTGRGRFLVGDEYVAKIKADMSQRNYFPYVIGGVLIIFAAFMAVIMHFSKMKDKPGDYILTPYTRIEVPKNRRLGKRK